MLYVSVISNDLQAKRGIYGLKRYNLNLLIIIEGKELYVFIFKFLVKLS